MGLDGRRVLITGATGYLGGHLVGECLNRGAQVRVLTRSADRVASQPWRDRVSVAVGDVTDSASLRQALSGVEVAYYLVHSMDGQGDFVARDRAAAETFAAAAGAAGVARVVYLGGLHPEGEELSAHLASRVEVGEILLAGPVPAAVLQAGVVIGSGSASFDMLRHLTERLPAMVTPRWVDNRIQPIAVEDVLHYLVAAAELPASSNRAWDIGGPEVLTYRSMMQQYAELAGLRRRWIRRVPALTPSLASHWVAAVTPVSSGIARPLVGSLVHDAVCSDRDAIGALGPPPGGRTSFADAVRRALTEVDPTRWSRTLIRNAAWTAAAAVLGSLLTDPDGAWYAGLDKPDWQPPAAAFPLVWTALYADIAATSTLVEADLAERGRQDQARSFSRALGLNLALNAMWSGLFFRARRPVWGALGAAALTASSADLVRRAKAAAPGRAAALAPYPLWCGFATVLSTEIARRNRS